MVNTRLFARLKARYWIVMVLSVTGLGLGLRFYAAQRLPINSDERIYLQAAVRYANFMRQGDWKMLAWDDYNLEHPVFYKMVYGLAMLSQPSLDLIDQQDFIDGMAVYKVNYSAWGLTGRHVSVILGGLAVLALTLVNPIAGVFFAIDTLAVQYTSMIFLEALPALASFLCALCYLRWYQNDLQNKKPSRGGIVWLGLSAVFLGMAAASKYNYAVVGIAVAIHFLSSVVWKKGHVQDVWKLAAWGICSLVVFFACDPYLWVHTFARLGNSLTFHLEHAQSERVQTYGYPFYQTLVWFSAPVTAFSSLIHSSGSFIVKPDTFVAVLALAGLPRLFARQRFYFIWLVTGLVVLLAWTTKWSQYAMIIMVPVCISAALGTGMLLDMMKKGLALLGNQRLKDKTYAHHHTV